MPFLAVSDYTKIYYEDYGEGDIILFIHGLGSSHMEMKNFIDEFKSDYRCISYDQRGHGSSDRPLMHLNVKRLGQDLNELITYLNLKNITIIGHSMGAAAIFSYVNQFGCNRLKQIISVDMSPYMRNTVWKGGVVVGEHTDEDFLCELDRIFDDYGAGIWHIAKLMDPVLAKIPEDYSEAMKSLCKEGKDPLTFASLWYSLFRTDQRPAMSKINVPFLYIMPENGLYSMVTADFIRENVKGGFKLEKNFPGTTHLILMEKPREVAECIKNFMEKGA